MIEAGTIFQNKGETWEVLRYDQYEDKFNCKILNSEQSQSKKFSEKEILEGMK